METKKPYVFISYSSKNAAEAEAVRNLLIRNGLQNWIAPHNIPAGAKYAHVIEEAIENCACVLLLLTQDAQGSDHIDREIERALSYKKEIIPIRLDRCALNPGFRYYIGNCQIVDVPVIDEANEEMRTIIQRLEQICYKELDAFLSFFEKAFSQWESSSKIYIVNPKRMQLLKDIYAMLITLLKEEGYEDGDYKITIEPDPLQLGNATISLVCDDITITNIKAFCEIARHLDNFEIYPRVDDKLHFGAVFRKIAHVSSNEKSEA